MALDTRVGFGDANHLQPSNGAPIPPTAHPSYGIQSFAGPADPYANSTNPDTMVQNSLEAMLNPNSRYIQDARQRGVEYAASRGGLTSSIAAGASERSAIEAATPLVQQSMDIQRQREQVKGQNWLDQQGFNRQFQGALAMMPITSSFNMMNMVNQAAIDDPELYTPDVVSGMNTFFNENMHHIMDQYFGTGG